MSIITLLTDYGTRDAYVAEMKGVILSITPDVTIVDITHDIEPFNVARGAFVLRQVWPFFPPGTVHLAVVDPGVGTGRRILLGQYAGQYVIAPDNGLITWVHRDFAAEAMHVVEDRRYFLPHLSTTFHGRDMMAPVAAHLAGGVRPRMFGRVTDRLELLPVAPRGELFEGGLRGRVICDDRFGNLVTNIRAEQLPVGRPAASCEVSVNGTPLGPIRGAFADAPAGAALAYIGGAGFLEIGVNQGSALERFGSIERIVVEVR